MRVIVAARLSQLVTNPNDTTKEGRLKSIQSGLDTQEKEVLKWAEANGHQIIDVAADFKTGASHIWDRPHLRPWVTEPDRLSQYDALVSLKVDRLTRANKAGTRALEEWATANGKQILISSTDVHFPSEGVDGVAWDLYLRFAHAEYLAIKERYARMQNAKHDAGSAVGRAPWGYTVVNVDGFKTIEPTREGRIWVPKVFAMIVSGLSARDVARELERHGVQSNAPTGRWHESTIAKMIHRSTYSGQRARAGRAALEVEPLVSRALQDKAVAMLSSRARVGGTGPTEPKALLAKLNCGHPGCPGEGTWPMYRIINRQQHNYYRCAGRGPQRRGCGAAIIRTEELDKLVLGFARYWDSRPYKSQRFVTGNDLGVRLERLRAEMGEAIRVAPSEKMGSILADYSGRIAALESEGSVQPHWEDVVTGETEGQHLRALDLDGRRDYLAHKTIKAWRDGPGGTIHVTIDGVTTQDRSIISAPHPEETD